jgi:hypothetical protein
MKSKTFGSLRIGETFDFIDPSATGYNSFFRTVVKTSPRGYMDEDGNKYRVGSISAKVFHVGKPFKSTKPKRK